MDDLGVDYIHFCFFLEWVVGVVVVVVRVCVFY